MIEILRKIITIISSALLILSTVSCQSETAPSGENAPEVQPGKYIADMFSDKSQYRPGDSVSVTIELDNTAENAVSATLNSKLTRFGEEVSAFDAREISLAAGEKKTETVTFTPPSDDFRGYAFEARLTENGKTMDFDMHAVDVSSDWNRYPRMGYLTKFHEQPEETVRKNLDWLSKFYITGLFYYDHLNAHDKPLAGTVEAPDAEWANASNIPVDGKTLEYIRTYANSKNTMNFAYNLIYGGYDDYLQKGLKAEWGIYKDQQHADQDFHPMHESFKTLKLWLFDPGNPGFEDFYVNIHRDVFAAQKWDGMILDTLSNRPYPVYDYSGNKLSLENRYANLFEKFRKEIGIKTMINTSDGYGVDQIAANTEYDILFGEIYTNSHPSYYSVKEAIDRDYGYTKGLRGASYPAYMHFESAPSNFKFNIPGVTFFNSVINASGGNHLELGDRDMLQVVHYPANKMKMGEELEAATRRQYDFAVAYEELLRGPGLVEVQKSMQIAGHNISRLGTKNSIWAFSKENSELNMEILHFFNFETIETTNWNDPKGKQPAPTVIKAAVTKYYTDKDAQKVMIGSPDANQGILRELKFTKGSDDKGKYVEFTMDTLEYWNMVVIK